ncbi:MAG: hypothetical protein IKE70_04180 [Bacilli bacterium]|nr:hypothetical protein [Bacilli bacterium]
MKPLLSLIKVSLNHDMNIFKINTKKQSKFSKVLLPLILTGYIMGMFGIYANELIKQLAPIHMEYFVLTLFTLSVSILTIIEGIYKSGNLLFNCKDDDLLLSLPIKRRTILFIRIFKFYVFELLYNSLFLLPGMIVYAYHTTPSWTYYVASFFALLLLPVIPIAISTIIGFLITSISSKFKGKNIAQTIVTTIFLLGIMFLSYNLDNFINNIAKQAKNINDFITRIYYPAGMYNKLVTNFQIKDLLVFIGINILILGVVILVLGKIYFKINSNNKKVLVKKNYHKNKNYTIKVNSKTVAIIKKELSRYVNSSVYIVNAGFGLVLFLLGCVIVCIKFDSFVDTFLKTSPELTMDKIKSVLPAIMFAFVCFTSFMTSITSSTISLEGKTIHLLKSLPLRTIEIMKAKIYSALVIMIPCILLGDIIVFIRFQFDILSILLILSASIILPILAETFGILVNLKYPKMDASNDTEVVKQSMSSMVATMSGMGVSLLTIIIIFLLFDTTLSPRLIILIFMAVFLIITIILWKILEKTCEKSFHNITT